MKRLRLRGDWSDTGPNARPDSASGPQASAAAPENSSNDANTNATPAAGAAANEQQQTSETENDTSETDQAEGLESNSTASTTDDQAAGQPRRRGPPVNQNLMQRMTDALSRMLNDPSTRLAMRTLSEREASR